MDPNLDNYVLEGDGSIDVVERITFDFRGTFRGASGHQVWTGSENWSGSVEVVSALDGRVTNGGVAPEPLSPLAQIGARFRRNKGRDVVPAS